MAQLNTEANYREQFYRLVGTTSADAALVENSESTNEVCDLALTQGLWQAQRFLVGCGMSWRWFTRSSAITSWSGTEAADGGRYTNLPSDLLILAGDERRSSLVEANGEPWGFQITVDQNHLTGDLFYLRASQLWITRGAAPPTTLYLEYVLRHPEFTTGVTLNFDVECAGLACAYAAQHAVAEGWFPRDADGKQTIANAVQFWEVKASKFARRSRQPRKQRPPRVIGAKWFS